LHYAVNQEVLVTQWDWRYFDANLHRIHRAKPELGDHSSKRVRANVGSQDIAIA
jgi:hypothetical protein